MQASAKLSIILSVIKYGEYVGDVIKDIKQQTLKNWECVVVGKSAEDSASLIAEKLIQGDERFRLVYSESDVNAAAFNKGLENVEGRYIAFCNPNTKIQEDYYEKLYNAANRNKADIAIAGLKQLNKATEKLHPMDPVLIKSLEISRRIISRAFIEREQLNFSDKGPGREHLFCLECISKASDILGCRDIDYRPRELPIAENKLSRIHAGEIFEESLATFEKAKAILEGRYNDLCKEVEDSQIAKTELDTLYEMSKSTLCRIFAERTIIYGIYRHFWITDKDTLDKAYGLLNTIKGDVFPHEWDEMVINNNDLNFDENELPDNEAISSVSKITFVIAGLKEKDQLNRILEGIYCQDFPQFEVMIDEELSEHADERWQSRDNFRELNLGNGNFRKEAYEQCHSKYIWFIDKPVYFSASIVRDMYNYIESNVGVLFVSAPVSRITEDGIIQLQSNKTAFLPEFNYQKIRTAYNQLDLLWGNKIISVTKLDAMKEPFRLGDADTLIRFYLNSRYRKNEELKIIADYSEDEVTSRIKSNTVRLRWKKKLKKEEKFEELLKSRLEYKTIARTKYKETRNRFIRFMTLKVIYPLIYTIFRSFPIDYKKVIFVEPAKLDIDGNLLNMRQHFEALGGYKIKTMCLGRKFVRVREQIKREARFVKEMATARYVFVAEALGVIGGFSKRKGTTVVQLWHGCGAFKQFGYSTANYRFGGDMKEKNAFPGYRNMDLITVSSPEVIWAYEEAMGYQSTDVVKATGISRTDVFYDKEYLKEAHERIYEIAPDARDKKIILYAPTFRGTIRRAKAPDRLDFRALKEALGKDYYMLTKHHPFVKVPPIIPDDCSDFALDVTSTANIDDLISCADICISDYSSLVFEYSLFERPLIFFAFDLEEYDEWRGFYYDYEELTPGPVVYTNEEIIEYIKNVENGFDKDEIIKFREKYMSACDGHASERILETIGI